MIGRLQWTSLQEQRCTIRLTMIYKIKNGLACARKQCPKTTACQGQKRPNQQFQQIQCRQDWNALPQATMQSPSLATFITKVSKSILKFFSFFFHSFFFLSFFSLCCDLWAWDTTTGLSHASQWLSQRLSRY